MPHSHLGPAESPTTSEHDEHHAPPQAVTQDCAGEQPTAEPSALTLEAAHDLHKDSPRACTVYGDFRQRVHDLRRLSALLDANRELRTFCPDVLGLADELVRIGALAIAKAARAERGDR